jgi:hypothetical protein
MAQPQIARFNCSQCDARFSSDRELRDHMQATHHKSVTDSSSTPANSSNQGCASSFIMEQRGEMDKLCGDVPKVPGEYVQPDEEKETGGQS